ncbi:TadE/TadG family type IV pilus assembly protein [Bosea sp. NPDC055353]
MMDMPKKTGLRIWRRFCRDRDGVAAVEFALLLPVMLITYTGMVDVVQLVMVNRKVTQLTSALSDLTARVQSVSSADVQNIFNAARSILMPYDSDKVTMVIASVVIDPAGVAKVCWSEPRDGTAPARGTSITIPDTYRVPGTSVIMARASYEYTPIVGYVLTKSFTLGDSPIYARPRNGVAGGTNNIEQVVRTGTNPCPLYN